MWRYIATRIRMGIVRLPAMAMYWQAELGDRYITQLLTRDREHAVDEWVAVEQSGAGSTGQQADSICAAQEGLKAVACGVEVSEKKAAVGGGGDRRRVGRPEVAVDASALTFSCHLHRTSESRRMHSRASIAGMSADRELFKWSKRMDGHERLGLQVDCGLDGVDAVDGGDMGHGGWRRDWAGGLDGRSGMSAGPGPSMQVCVALSSVTPHST